MIPLITPPFELMNQWYKKACKDPYNGGQFIMSQVLKDICTQASQWGWDQRGAANEAELQQARDEELKGCEEWVADKISAPEAAELRAARRPKPPSKADLALKSLEGMALPEDAFDTISRALERLKELESQR